MNKFFDTKDHGPRKQRRHFVYHQGRRERIRNLNKQCRRFLDSKDPAILAQGYRIMQHCQKKEDPGFKALYFMAAAVDLSKKFLDLVPDGEGVPVMNWTPDSAWIKAVDMIFEEIEKRGKTETAVTDGGNQDLDAAVIATSETR